MTLIASYDIYEHPILIGDIMISSPSHGKSYKPYNIPTHADVNNNLPDYVEGYMVSSLKQKVILINKNLAIAWAGNEIAARTVIKDINEMLADKEPAIDKILNFFEKIDYLGNMQLYLTGIVLQRYDDKIACLRFAWDSDLGWNSGKYTTQELSEIYVGGSGCDDFKNIVRDMRILQSRQMTPTEKAIITSLSIISQLTGHQMRTGAGLPMFYGGGFELVTLLDGELQKIDDIIYHFWIVKRLPDGKIRITFQATLKVAYYQDFLVIHKVVMYTEPKKDNRPTIKNEIYATPPIHITVSEEEKEAFKKAFKKAFKEAFKSPPLNARFSVFYIHVPQADENNNVLSFAHYSGNKTPPVKYSFDQDIVKIEISAELIERLNSGVNKLLNSNK